MVAQLLRLKLQLTANAFRRSPWQIFGLVIAIAYGVFLLVTVFSLLVSARSSNDVDLVRSIVVIAGSIAVIGFIVIPVLFGGEDALDPRRFPLFGIETSTLTRDIAIASFASASSVAVAVCAIGTIVTWSRNPGSVILAVICAAIAVATCTMLGRVANGLGALFLAPHRTRGFGAVLGVLLLVVVAPVAALLLTLGSGPGGASALHAITSFLRWTPIGAVWAAPADAALGSWGAPIVELLIALAFLALIWAVWLALVPRLIAAQTRETAPKSYLGLGWFGVLPSSPGGAIAARSLTYWGRDPRYWVPVLIIPIAPVVPVIALIIAGVPANVTALLPLPIMCLLFGWSVHNDAANDSTAIWLHVASGTRGAADRIGRLLPVLLIGIPLIGIGSIVTAGFYGDWSVLPGVLGVSSAVLFVGMGVSSVSSALVPYPTTKPGDSAFAQPQQQSSAPAAMQSLTLLVTLVFAAPAIALAARGLMTASPETLLLALVVGTGSGLLVLVLGVIAGAAVFNRRAPELMASAIRFD